MMTTLTNLAATVEAGFAAAEEANDGFKYSHGGSYETEITAGINAFAEYKRRAEALEAFVQRVHDTYTTFTGNTENSAYEEWSYLDDKARALLADDTAAGDELST